MSAARFGAREQLFAVKGLIGRLLPGKEGLFELSVSPLCLGAAACYNLRVNEGRVQIFGSSGDISDLVKCFVSKPVETCVDTLSSVVPHERLGALAFNAEAKMVSLQNLPHHGDILCRCGGGIRPPLFSEEGLQIINLVAPDRGQSN